jgi:Secretion system C-terminal sorting domain
MKLKLLKLSGIAFLLCFSTFVSAQTAGTMVYTFTTVKAKATGGTMTATSSGVFAVWIENAAGTFIRTGARFVGASTSDHLPTYTLKIGGNTTGGFQNGYNALSGTPGTIIPAANSGATRTPSTVPPCWGSHSIQWDGKDVTGAIVTDGVYKVWFEIKWGDSGTNNHDFINTGFSFTKGTQIYDSSITAPIADVNFLTVNKITWTPSNLGLESYKNGSIAIYPNPSKGTIKLDYTNIPVSKIDVVNELGQVVKSVNVDTTSAATTKSIDLSQNANGLYIINVSTNETSSSYKFILAK